MQEALLKGLDMLETPEHDIDLINQFVVGPMLMVIGAAMFALLFYLSRMPATDIYGKVGIIIGVQAYSLVAILFLLVGLQYLIGPQAWIDRWASRALGGVVTVSVVGSLVVAGFWVAVWV